MEEIGLLSHRLLFYSSLGIFFWVGLRTANREAMGRGRKEYLSVVLSVPSGFLCSFFLINSNPLATALFGKYGAPYSFLFHWIFIVLVGAILALLFVFSIVKSKKWNRD